MRDDVRDFTDVLFVVCLWRESRCWFERISRNYEWIFEIFVQVQYRVFRGAITENCRIFTGEWDFIKNLIFDLRCAFDTVAYVSLLKTLLKTSLTSVRLMNLYHNRIPYLWSAFKSLEKIFKSDGYYTVYSNVIQINQLNNFLSSFFLSTASISKISIIFHEDLHKLRKQLVLDQDEKVNVGLSFCILPLMVDACLVHRVIFNLDHLL